MRACAEKVVGPLHEECVSTRPSSKGNYLSVTLSFWVETPEQVGSGPGFVALRSSAQRGCRGCGWLQELRKSRHGHANQRERQLSFSTMYSHLYSHQLTRLALFTHTCSIHT